MKIRRRSVLWILFWGALSLTLTQRWHFERLDQWLQSQVKTQTKKHIPLEVLTDTVEVQVLPPKVILHNVQIEPLGALASQLQPLTIKNTEISPSLLHLLIGRVHIAKILLDGVSAQVNHEIKESKEPFRLALEKILRMVPITQIELNDIHLKLKLKKGEHLFHIQTGPLQATLTNDLNSLLVQTQLDNTQILLDQKQLLSKTFLTTHLFLTEKSLVLSDFKIKEGNSFIVASGSTQHSLSHSQLKSGQLNLRVSINSEHAKNLYTLFLPAQDTAPLDPLSWTLKSDLRIELKDLAHFVVKTKTHVADLVFEKFHVGDLELDGEYKHAEKMVYIEEALIKNSGLQGSVGPARLDLQKLTFGDTPVHLKHFSLQPYLKYSIHKEVPAHVDAQGRAQCGGALNPLKIDCTGEFVAEKIKVDTESGKPLIALNSKANVKGTLTVSADDVTYKATANLGHSQGESDGVINYKKGFQINYRTNELDLTAIHQIANLEIGGKAKIQGSTKGDGEAATFDLLFDGKEVSLEKYKLGELTGQLSYQSGTLSVQKIQGTASSSRYLGQLQINLPKNTINGRIQFPFIDLAVTQEAIKENLDIPVALSGTGAAVVQIDSLLNPNLLSFKAKARLYNCKVDQQHIETADIDVTSEKGKVKINNAVFEEKNTLVQADGYILLDRKEYDVGFSSNKLYLDDIVYTTKYTSPTRGLFSVQGKVKGPFKAPNLETQFASDYFLLAGKKISPLKGSAQIFSNKKVFEIFGPQNFKFLFRDIHSLPYYNIEGTTQDFDVAPLVTSLLDIEHIDDLKVAVSSQFNLKIPRDNPQQINGYVFLPKLELDTEKNKLSTEKELSLFFTNGRLNFSSFEMLGSGGKINVKSNATPHPLDLTVSGLFSLSFVHIFAPFLETIEGQTTVNVRVQKRTDKLEFFGSAFIDDGYVKLPDIQHGVENLKVDILFNQDRININSLKARFASGQMLGDGFIRILGPKNIPIELNLHLDNIDLNIPEDVNTIGSADLKLRGSWLPFELSGTYKVIDGLISKELSGGPKNEQSAHEVFLPPALRNEKPSPITLALDIIPVSPIKIKNSLVDGKIQGQIRVTGAPQNPILGGQISFTKFSQIIFRDVTFRVRDSNISLNNTNPPNPAIYILADTRYKGYDIEILVQGDANNPKFNLTSQPSLTQPEIISLLALGYTTNPQNISTQNSTTTTQNNQGIQVGTGVFGQNPLGQELKNRFGVDVQFSSRFDSNTSVAVPTVGFSKRISEKTSVVGSVQTGKENRAEGKVRYELDRGFAATMSVQSRTTEDASQLRGNTNTDILGIDLEFRKEFK